MSCIGAIINYYYIFSGTITNTTWLPSTIPIPDIVAPETLKNSDGNNYTQAVTDCLAVLSDPNITANCPDVLNSGVTDHLLEACIREHYRGNTENATGVLFNSLLFFCEGAMGVSSCLFVGHLDFICIPESDSSESGSSIMMIGAAAGGLLLLIIIIVTIILVRKRCKSKKGGGKEDDDELLDDWRPVSNMRFRARRVITPDPDVETSFTRPGSVTLSDSGRQSVDTINSRVLASPVSFVNNQDSRLSFYLNMNSPTPNEGRNSVLTQHGQSASASNQTSHTVQVGAIPENETIDNTNVTSVAHNAPPRSPTFGPFESVTTPDCEVYHPTPQPLHNNRFATSPTETPVPSFGASAPFSLKQSDENQRVLVTPNETPIPSNFPQAPITITKEIRGVGTWKQLPFPVPKIPVASDTKSVPTYTSGAPVTVSQDVKADGTWTQLPFPVQKIPRTTSVMSKTSTQTDISVSEDQIEPPN